MRNRATCPLQINTARLNPRAIFVEGVPLHVLPSARRLTVQLRVDETHCVSNRMGYHYSESYTHCKVKRVYYTYATYMFCPC